MAGTVPLVLTQRDIQILIWTYELRGCTADHIRFRFFPTPGARSACYTRIQKLVDAEYLASLRLPARYGIGSGKAFLTPGPGARPVLAEILGLSRAELGRIRMDAPPVIAHHLAICDTRLAVELAAERSSVFTLREWHGDGAVSLRVTDPKTESTIPLIPDSSFVLALPDGTEQTFLLEQDMGTVAAKRMRTRFRGYLSRPAELMAPVLIVAPDRGRLVALTAWAVEEARTPRTDPTVFWLSTARQLTPETVIAAPIWQVAGGPDAVSLEGLAAGAEFLPAVYPTTRHTLVGGLAR